MFQWNGVWRVGVATANRPQGPFKDSGKPLDGMAGIDPMVFIDDDGEAYMYLNDYQIAKMKPNMMELAEEPRFIDYAPDWVKNDNDKKFEEGSFMHKHNGKYFYSYSNWQENGPTAYYGVGDSPYGPFQWKGELAGSTRGAPDHHSIINFRGEYYYFYHMDTPWQDKNEINWHGHRRLACFDRMYHDPGNSIQPVVRTYGQPIYVPGADMNPCAAANSCPSGFTCVNTGNGNFDCEYRDPCDKSPCSKFELCIDLGEGNYMCDPVDPCKTANCQDNEYCKVNNLGDAVCKYDDRCDGITCGDDEYCKVNKNGKARCKPLDERGFFASIIGAIVDALMAAFLGK